MKEGLLCASAGQSPGLVAISIKAAIHAPEGRADAVVWVPIPLCRVTKNFKAGNNYYPDLTDNFFTRTSSRLATSTSRRRKSWRSGKQIDQPRLTDLIVVHKQAALIVQRTVRAASLCGDPELQLWH